jgi:hypothetical protein
MSAPANNDNHPAEPPARTLGLPAALVKHVLMPLLDVKSTESLERTSKSVYASMQTRDSLRAYDCLKIMHRDVQAAVQQQSIDVQAALQFIKDAIARNEFIRDAVDRNESVDHLQPFPRNEVLYKQGWALKYMHYLWATQPSAAFFTLLFSVGGTAWCSPSRPHLATCTAVYEGHMSSN